MPALPPQPRQPDPDVIKRHDDLVEILDWQAATPAAPANYWETKAGAFTTFAEALVKGVTTARDKAEARATTKRKAREKAEAEARLKAEAEAKARAEAEAKARAEAEAKAKAEGPHTAQASSTTRQTQS
jgi:membrane protein involved in colicin uptake